MLLARRKGALLTWALLACCGLEFSEDLLSMAGEDTLYYLDTIYDGAMGGKAGVLGDSSMSFLAQQFERPRRFLFLPCALSDAFVFFLSATR